MKRIIILALFFLCIIPFNARAEELIKKGEVLTLERCLSIAATMQPSIIASQYAIDVNRSLVDQAKSVYYPQIEANASYSRIKALTGVQRAATTGIPGTVPSNANEPFNQYSGSVTLSQLIYDFGKTRSQVDITNLNVDSAKSNLENTFDQVSVNVKQAYFGVLLAKGNEVVAQESVKQYVQHLGQAKGFYEVGTRPKFDVTKAEVDLSTAQLTLIKATNAVKVAVTALNNAMGVPAAPEYELQDDRTFEKYGLTLDQAIQKAYENRSDLRSLEAQRKAAERNVDFAMTGYYPVLSGNGAYNVGGSDFPLEKGWSVGVGVSIPIFNGFLTKSQVAQAKANLSVVKANEESLRQSIYQDVEQAYIVLRNAEESIGTAELSVKQATENLEIANGRYSAGVGNPIEVTDAEVLLTNAKTSYNQAFYSDKIAKAAIEKAMGLR